MKHKPVHHCGIPGCDLDGIRHAHVHRWPTVREWGRRILADVCEAAERALIVAAALEIFIAERSHMTTPFIAAVIAAYAVGWFLTMRASFSALAEAGVWPSRFDIWESIWIAAVVAVACALFWPVIGAVLLAVLTRRTSDRERREATERDERELDAALAAILDRRESQ